MSERGCPGRPEMAARRSPTDRATCGLLALGIGRRRDREFTYGTATVDVARQQPEAEAARAETGEGMVMQKIINGAGAFVDEMLEVCYWPTPRAFGHQRDAFSCVPTLPVGARWP